MFEFDDDEGTQILKWFGGEKALMDYLGIDKAASEDDTQVVLSEKLLKAAANLQERLRAHLDGSEALRSLYLEMMAAAYLVLVDMPPEEVELVQEMRTEEGQIKVIWYFRRRE